VVPDVFVRRTDHGWGVDINPATLPRVRAHQGYANLIGAQRQPREHARSAAGGALAAQEPGDPPRNPDESRPASIVERQTAFLEQGESTCGR